jgi:hypothetical protein
MKPFSMNLSKMKKISGDKESSTFMHPSGHKMVIAHSAVSPSQRTQLEKMPIHLAGGGMDNEPNSSSLDQTEDTASPVTTPPDQSLGAQIGSGLRSAYQSISQPIQETPEQQQEEAEYNKSHNISDFFNAVRGQPTQPDQAQPDANAPASAQDLPDYGQPVQGPAQSPQRTAAAVPAIGGGGSNLAGAYEQGLAGLREEQGVNTALAQQAVNRGQQQALDDKWLRDQGDASLSAIQKAHDDFNKDFMANKIDPRAYLENMSTGQKVATAIGMLFGGIGSARTGAPNYAVDFLNKQIERNIQAQQSRMDQQKTLLGANEEIYKDKTNALTATRINMTDSMMHQAQLAAAQQGTPTADAIFKQKAADWAFQRSQLMNQMAMRDTILKAAQNGNTAITPQHLVMAGFMNPEEGAKEQGSIDKQKDAIAQGNDIYNQLAQKNSASYLARNPVQGPAEVGVLHARLASIVQSANPSERLSSESAKMEILPYESRLVDNAQGLAAKHQGFNEHVKAKFAGQTPITGQYAPNALPNYNTPAAQSVNAPQQYRVGQILRDKNTGQRIQIIDAKGNVKPVSNG